ncbi:response regulator transcription factor [Nonomuraea sp. C10]|uniref:response regulator n=1 Tax=Nonomuraea sp. C10 TaxID=2600577 RepID=UPI0011CDDA93|nr:response regulator transcription factor [Nonomuraea sp. C10]TXK34874.1 response regulator transcription factor [Nonomuraea sp. C10]
MIRVLIADDQPTVRRSLRTFLELDGDIKVIAEASNGREAVDRALALRPDVVLMDVRMPGGDGITATARLAGPDAENPIPVVVITTFDLDEYVFGALENGAAGFLLKDTDPAHLTLAVRAAAAGDGLVSPSVTARVIREFARRKPPTTPTAPLPELTAREQDVLAALADGLSNAEIAGALFVEVGTVKTHVSRIIAKLGVRDRVQAVIWAHQNPHWNLDSETRRR